jgi:FdhE protein
MRYPDRERRRLRQLEDRRAYLGEVLDFMGALATATDAVRPRYDDGEGALAPGADPPLAPARFPLDTPAAAAAFDAFLRIFEAGAAGDAASTRRALESGALDAETACRAYLARDEGWFERTAAEHGVDPNFLVRLAELALRPQAVERARRYRAPTEAVADRCPACGGTPEIALLADRDGVVGARIGVCGFCETEWRLPRTACVRCGNDIPDQLGYLNAKDDPAVRAAVCDRCRSYLIVVDTRGRTEIAPAVERAAALPLDIVAQAEGYAPVGGRSETQ